LLIIIYVGAVAVLFLFVVMMLNVDFAALKADMAKFLPIGLLMGIVILIELGLVFGDWKFANNSLDLRVAITPPLHEVHNTEALGLLIYDEFIYLFQASGLILLVAMIGAIVLTMRHRKGIKRQNVMEQMSRDPSTAMELKDVKSGQGL
jgi:NADH-quinone oxidoreductase subunit J